MQRNTGYFPTESLEPSGNRLFSRSALNEGDLFRGSLEMMKMGNCMGVRVGDITKKTNLSRPAVSHHLQIMKDAGIVKVRKEGTKNYYYFDPEMEAFEQLVSTLQLAMKISKKLPDRSCE